MTKKFFGVFIVISLSVAGWLIFTEKEPVSEASVTIPDRPFLSETVELDGKTYTKKELLEDYINIAFSEKDWPNLYWQKNRSTRTPRYEKKYSDSEIKGISYAWPWAVEYMYPETKRAGGDVVHKWHRSKVDIGFDWPKYTHAGNGVLKSYRDSGTKKIKFYCSFHSDYCEYVYELSEGKHTNVVDHVKSVSQQLENITGLELNVVMPDDDQEQTEDYPRIRIQPVSSNVQKNFFKMYRFGYDEPVRETYGYFYYADHLLADRGVTFTTDIRSQVDGYLFYNNDNALGLSVCKIMPVVGGEMMKALITECLVRALGLPDVSKKNDTAMIGHWNSRYNEVSKLDDLDGREEALYMEDVALGDKTIRRVNHFYLPQPKDFPVLYDELSEHQKLSDYDRYMIKLHYCDAVQSGMNRQETVEALIEERECF